MERLRVIAEGVWGIEDVVTPSPGFRMPARATVVRLAGGEVVLHAPLAIDDEVARELAALGPVKHIVAPSCLHWMFVKGAVERYPDARVLGVEGLEQKLTAKAGVRFEPLANGAFGDELEVLRIAGAPSINEHVLLHGPSRSLLLSDLVFNIHADASWPMSMLLWINGAHRKTAQSRVWRFAVKDRAAAAESASALLARDYERVVVGHGDVIEDDARERMRRALAWMTGSPAQKSDAAAEADVAH
ncbi:MAG: DUF4336 domain-containing protein [Labilithrix sp.]|nr:DUF4336 domain-containing protein [Labilithrix sp.]MCW5813677.1 DUF4336 domain-containing protein [Labilithrix sp.]